MCERNCTRQSDGIGVDLTQRPPDDYLRERSWGDDRVAALLTKAATAPATTTQAGWAAELGAVACIKLSCCLY
jgi:hypothetical protein